MSHHFHYKKIWIGMLGAAVLFWGLCYAWFYYTNQYMEQAQRQESQEASSQESLLSGGRLVAEAAQDMLPPLAETGAGVRYPCQMVLRGDTIGLYDSENRLLKTMKQTGEYLSETDRAQLIRGISVEDEEQLILLCESYHLQ